EHLEIWLFTASHQLAEPIVLVFVKDTGAETDSLIRWSPTGGLSSLSSHSADSALERRSGRPDWVRQCRGGGEVFDALAMAVEWDQLRATVHFVPEPTTAWAEAFLSRSSGLPSSASPLPANLRLEFPGRHQYQTIVQGLITIPIEAAAPSEAGDGPTYSFQVEGEVVKDDRLLESFRYRFDFAAEEISGDVIPLVIQRQLRPQAYKIVIQVEDQHSNRIFREEREIQVPAVAQTPIPPERDPPPSIRDDSESEAARFVESAAALSSAEHSLKILPPSSELHTDRLRVEAVAGGKSIAKVTFILNGKPVMSKSRPPYSVEIDLGRSPRLHSLEALAVDQAGRVLARDRVPINAGPHRFSIRLLQPQSGERFVSSLRAVAEVDVPRGEVLERVEFYLNNRRLASLYQPPYAQPLVLPENQRITYVRAVAYLRDGNSTEDLVFINAPDQMDRLRIHFVELFTSVSDRRGSPVEGLDRESFQVFEEGVPQSIRRFERVRDLPIHAGILLDTSTSMAEEISEAIEGALRFFEGVVRPRDRAAVVVFNDAPRLAVPFTSNHQVLAGGLVDLEAEGETALFDSLVFTLHYFSGIKGKRALIVLSDGEDSSSRYSFDETLEFARRSGVAIYSIGLGLPSRQLETRMRLQRFAADTGGRYFVVSHASELASIYESIEEELRFQYLLAYQSTDSEGDEFRRVEVRVSRPDLEATTVPGYYP
ncbi:MAG: VWA domain-containing protein, partial [Thermoanaerobaculia bacterium]